MQTNSCYPDTNEEGALVDIFENVPLIVNFTSIDLVAQSHHDKRVENYGKMLWRGRIQLTTTARLDIKKQLTKKSHTELH